MTDDLIERAAAAHYAASTDSRVELAWEACHPMYRAQQARAMQSALQAIHDAGFAVVPCEATDAMLKARLDVMQYGSWGYDHEADERRRYTAMISAAQHNTEEKT